MSRLRSTASGGLGLGIAQTDVIPHAGLRGYFRAPGDLWIHFCDRESLCYVPGCGGFLHHQVSGYAFMRLGRAEYTIRLIITCQQKKAAFALLL